MKILAPVQNHGEVEALLRAGADEFYCGLTPSGWTRQFGAAWANRRNPRSAGLSGEAELERIVAAAGAVPVFVALNSPHYPPGAVEMLARFGRRLLEHHGVSALIVADMDLLLALVDAGHAARLHVSSLATCSNPGAARFFRNLGVARIILPRHLTLGEVRDTVIDGVEFEAFLLNDGCVFEEGLCATTHQVGAFCLEDGNGAEGIGAETLERYGFWKWTLNNCGCRDNRGYPLGPCGLCAIPALLAAGIGSFKVVGREASAQRKAASVHLARAAVDLARAGGDAAAIRERVVGLRGARSLCAGRHACYYPSVWDAAAAGEEQEGRCWAT